MAGGVFCHLNYKHLEDIIHDPKIFQIPECLSGSVPGKLEALNKFSSGFHCEVQRICFLCVCWEHTQSNSVKFLSANENIKIGTL